MIQINVLVVKIDGFDYFFGSEHAHKPNLITGLFKVRFRTNLLLLSSFHCSYEHILHLGLEKVES